ncbi:hypothetical protein RHMOL_Rhmol11G0181600 [Rhododendron molle]|uniref:Uncharacterized protein n=1 Tax=Rhododendron molle TaxID=49168 RepID=A0ACC0LVA0_RHOML|nr:hypothetical protein RHMOL_Rhmol11G0181600 [Rhododendron molle]
MDSVSVAGSPDPTDGEGPSSTSPGGGKSAETGSTAAERRDWNTFLQYLRNHKPPLNPSRCSAAHVLEFLRYLDQLGKTKVHLRACPYFGNPNPPALCTCPLRQMWGSLDERVGLLRAAYEDNGGQPESNPFRSRAVRMYLRELRDDQLKERGILYKKMGKRETAAENASVGGGSSGGASDVAATVAPSTKTCSTRAVRIYSREVRDEQAKARGIPCKQKRKRATAAENVSVGGSSSGGAPESMYTNDLVGDEGKDQRKEISSGGFFSSEIGPDEMVESDDEMVEFDFEEIQDPKSRGEEGSECLQLHVDNYSDSDSGLSHSCEEEVMEELLLLAKKLEGTPSDQRELEDLNCDPREVPPTISHKFSILQVLDLSNTEINFLPQSISRLLALKQLFLRSCELLMELPPEIGELTNLEVLDLEGTEILCLPKEIGKLVNLTCLKVSFCGYANQTVIPRRVLSNLSCLIELIIDVTPFGEWWDVEVEAIIDDLCSLKKLRTLKLYLHTPELLEDLILIFPGLANFRFTVGHHNEHFISRLPYDVEEEFNERVKLEKGLKYINGNHLPNEITKVFKHANAFFLQRHWTAKSLSEFGHENMNEVKYCLVMECNEFRTIIDFEQFCQGKDGGSESKDFRDFDETIVLGSLEKLIICYMKNMESVWKGPVGKGSLSNLKSLALHTCPNLTTLFTIDVFRNLLNLEELIVEDCPKIDSLVSLKSSDSKSGLFLPNLKKISLLELPELVSISSGLCIALNLERMVIFYCPKLEKLSTMDVSSTKLKVIKGEREWWDALKWYESDLSTEHEDYLARRFIPLRRDGNLMAQLTKD